MGSRKKTADDYAADGAGEPSTSSRPGFVKRHKVAFIAFVSLVAVLALMIGGFAFALNHSLSKVTKVPLTIPEASRPTADSGKDLNILMLGADAGTARNGKKSSILADAAAKTWPAGKNRSDATMLVHITADRKHAYVVSIPRDSYVKIYDSTGTARDDTKINAALSLYGPSGAISTVENFTGLRIDHLAMVDWDGFKDITDALGGVDISVNGAPTTRMTGDEALTYVRERHNLPHGDFDRVKRQQNFLRALMSKLVSKGTLTNPLKLNKTTSAVASHLAVDDDWSNSSIRSLLFSMRNIRPGNVTFMTIPTKGTASDPIAGSIVVVDKAKDTSLFEALQKDSLSDWITDNPGWKLGGYADVS